MAKRKPSATKLLPKIPADVSSAWTYYVSKVGAACKVTTGPELAALSYCNQFASQAIKGIYVPFGVSAYVGMTRWSSTAQVYPVTTPVPIVPAPAWGAPGYQEWYDWAMCVYVLSNLAIVLAYYQRVRDEAMISRLNTLILYYQILRTRDQQRYFAVPGVHPLT